MTRFAIVEHTTKKVVNCIEWEGAEFLPPRNHYVIKSDVADIGDIFDSDKKTFTKTNLSEPDKE